MHKIHLKFNTSNADIIHLNEHIIDDLILLIIKLILNTRRIDIEE